MDNRYLVAGGIGALVVAAVVAAFIFLMPERAATVQEASTDPAVVDLLAPKPDDIGIGDPKAPIRFVEYASSGCGHCAAFALDVLPQIKAKYIDTGKLYYVLRDFPLDQPAANASVVARCMPTDKFYPFMELLFREQANWHANGIDLKEALITVSRKAGLSREQVESCLKDQAVLDRITKSRSEAVDVLKVNSTPTMFINGDRIVGAPAYGEFEKAIDKALQPAPAP